MKHAQLKQLKQGEFFKYREDGPVWIKNHYDRTSKKYSISLFDDVNKERFVNGFIPVIVGFDF